MNIRMFAINNIPNHEIGDFSASKLTCKSISSMNFHYMTVIDDFVLTKPKIYI